MQTAVEWLVERLIKRQNGDFDGIPVLSRDEMFEQAKEMHKQQIIDAVNLPNYKLINERYVHISGEQYYNETYGNRTENN